MWERGGIRKGWKEGGGRLGVEERGGWHEGGRKGETNEHTTNKEIKNR